MQPSPKHQSSAIYKIAPPSVSPRRKQRRALREPHTSLSEPIHGSLTQLAELGQQTAMLVHEMRSPLSVILNGLSLCRKMPLPERVQQRLTLALEEAERLNRMVDEVLAYVRYSHHPPIQWQEIDLTGLMHAVLQVMAQLPIAQGRQMVFSSALSEVWIRGDRDQIKQVFINLLRNACEAVFEGETITCELEMVGGNRVCIVIHNGGTPIPAKLLPELTQQHRTTKIGGHGLGLILVRRIIEAHHGQFTLESSPLVGTIARVTLPTVGEWE